MFEEYLEKLIPSSELAFSVHLCEHCNLNCAGCNNFSNIADESYTDLVLFTKDMERLADLSGGVAYRIQLTGGEPLLNQNAVEYAKAARQFFPYARISFITNGILLKRQSDTFFSDLSNYNIDIDLTPYPIRLNYDEIGKFLEAKGVVWKYQNEAEVKVMRKEVFDLNPNHPKSKGTHNWLKCYMANNCMQLYNGKMACTRIHGIKHFKSKFPNETERMMIQEKDMIDIYKVETIEEIFNFFSRPFPFCKYCDVDNWNMSVEWRRSEQSISEWI